MKSLMITKYGDISSSLEQQEVTRPIIEANQILIKTYSSSFNPYDYKVVKGDFPLPPRVHAGEGFPVTRRQQELAHARRQLVDLV